jgi:hypothetical protein
MRRDARSMDDMELFKQDIEEVMSVRKELLAMQQKLSETSAFAIRSLAIAAILAIALRDKMDDTTVNHVRGLLSSDGLAPEHRAMVEAFRSKLA